MSTEILRVSAKLKELKYVSNMLSTSRLFLLPFIIIGLTRATPGYKAFTLVMMTLAMLTDALDGYAARRLKEVSALGKILDPLCDKIGIGVIAIAVTLMRDYPWWAMGFIILRDVVIIVGGILMIEQWTVITSSNIWGKATSHLQSLSIIVYAFNLPYKTYPLTVALVFTGVSGISYAMEFYHLKRNIGKPETIKKADAAKFE